MNLAVIAIGYNRTDGLIRLLNSLERANYCGDKVPLIISIDNSGSDDVEIMAKNFIWSHGEKIIRTFPERQGLRRHVLSCGDYLEKYDAVAVFEDDLLASPAYYTYMRQAVAYYKDSDEIAGISLYSHRTNLNNLLPFTADGGYSDVFFMQFAPSWGQIWMRKQWFAFKEWYEKNEGKPLASGEVPKAVSGWPDTSWLKYHIKYCIAENKFFVYPYCALSTCFDDAGTHCKKSDDRYNVPISSGSSYNYTFCPFSDGIKYDAFFERIGLEKYLSLPENSLCSDVYGYRESYLNKKYILTRNILPYKKVKTFAMSMRPQECNIIYNVEGDEIKLYDSDEECPLEKEKKTSRAHKTVDYYYNIACKFTDVLKYSWYRIKDKFNKKK